jgi:hypothetical protein
LTREQEGKKKKEQSPNKRQHSKEQNPIDTNCEKNVLNFD